MKLMFLLILILLKIYSILGCAIKRQIKKKSIIRGYYKDVFSELNNGIISTAR